MRPVGVTRVSIVLRQAQAMKFAFELEWSFLGSVAEPAARTSSICCVVLIADIYIFSGCYMCDCLTDDCRRVRNDAASQLVTAWRLEA